MITFDVKTEGYNGPLDLLLSLVEKMEVSIFDIPIAPITEQYLAHVKNMARLDMEELSGFILLASHLLAIKAKELLPRNTRNDTEIEEEADPREELVKRLLEYKLYKEQAGELSAREKTGLLALYREKDESLDFGNMLSISESITGVVPIERLRKIFEDVLLRRELRTDSLRAGFGLIKKERFTIENRMAKIAERLKMSGRVSFFALFDTLTSKTEILVTFLALLELVKRQRVLIIQETLFDDVVCLGCDSRG